MHHGEIRLRTVSRLYPQYFKAYIRKEICAFHFASSASFSFAIRNFQINYIVMHRRLVTRRDYHWDGRFRFNGGDSVGLLRSLYLPSSGMQFRDYATSKGRTVLTGTIHVHCNVHGIMRTHVRRYRILFWIYVSRVISLFTDRSMHSTRYKMKEINARKCFENLSLKWNDVEHMSSKLNFHNDIIMWWSFNRGQG